MLRAMLASVQFGDQNFWQSCLTLMQALLTLLSVAYFTFELVQRARGKRQDFITRKEVSDALAPLSAALEKKADLALVTELRAQVRECRIELNEFRQSSQRDVKEEIRRLEQKIDHYHSSTETVIRDVFRDLGQLAGGAA